MNGKYNNLNKLLEIILTRFYDFLFTLILIYKNKKLVCFQNH